MELRGKSDALQSEMENATLLTKQKMDAQMQELQRMFGGLREEC